MLFAYKGLEQDFLPLEDKSRMFCIVFTPNGSTSEFTDRQLQKAEKIVEFESAKIVKLEEEHADSFWLACNNFYVITRYNRSPLYAMAVYQLSEEIRRGMGK